MAFGVHRYIRPRQAAWWTLVTGLVVTAGLGWELHREAVVMDRVRAWASSSFRPPTKRQKPG